MHETEVKISVDTNYIIIYSIEVCWYEAHYFERWKMILNDEWHLITCIGFSMVYLSKK